MSERTFTKNPFLEITASQPNTQLLIQASSDITSPLGLYLFQTDKHALNELNQLEIDLATSNKVFSLNHNSLYFDCGKKTGALLLAPCAYNSRIEGKCRVKVQSTKPVEVKHGRNREYVLRKELTLGVINPPSYFIAAPTYNLYA